MSHFYAIAVRRLKDYTEAGLPVWPARYGVPSAKRQIVFFIVLFIVANVLLVVHGSVGIAYAVVMVPIGLAWLQRAVHGFKADDDTAWAKRTFLFSLVVLLGLCIMLSLGVFLP
jgi:protoheme IX farnesyltransferase